MTGGVTVGSKLCGISQCHRGSQNDTGSVIQMIVQIALRVLIAAAPKAVARHSSGAVRVE